MFVNFKNMFPESKGKNILTFELLEDVMNLNKSHQAEILAGTSLYRIGPAIEYLYQTELSKLDLFDRNSSSVINPLKQTLQLKNFQLTPLITSYNAFQIEFHKCYEKDSEQSDARWMAYCKRLEDAAKKAGLQEQFAKALVGTFDEMTGNVLDHSENSSSGIVGYRWDNSEFEYVVADLGIGVLNSLKTNDEYKYLRDSGEALETALKPGASRYETVSGHGFGFRSLLENIASRNSYLRFRSGDHYHMIDGTGEKVKRSTIACTNFNGFLISLVCKSKSFKSALT
jgi:hypothetical protein